VSEEDRIAVRIIREWAQPKRLVTPLVLEDETPTQLLNRLSDALQAKGWDDGYDAGYGADSND
jgi:hypothetical protein